MILKQGETFLALRPLKIQEKYQKSPWNPISNKSPRPLKSYVTSFQYTLESKLLSLYAVFRSFLADFSSADVLFIPSKLSWILLSSSLKKSPYGTCLERLMPLALCCLASMFKLLHKHCEQEDVNLSFQKKSIYRLRIQDHDLFSRVVGHMGIIDWWVIKIQWFQQEQTIKVRFF